MDDFRVKKAAEVLKRFFDDRTIQDASRFEAFRSTWKQIVGLRLADHSRPKSVLHRTLLIAADHAGWIQLLQMDQERILKRISQHYPELDITSLAFTIENVDDRLSDASAAFRAESREDQNKNESGPDAGSDMGGAEVNLRASSPSPSSTKNVDLPRPLDEIFSRMRSKDPQRSSKKGN